MVNGPCALRTLIRGFKSHLLQLGLNSMHLEMMLVDRIVNSSSKFAIRCIFIDYGCYNDFPYLGIHIAK